MISIAAPAKINLYLHVTGQRSDGLHLLDSLIVCADFGDEISVKPGRSLSLEINGPFAKDLKPVTGNLVMKAATLLAGSMGLEARAALSLTKNLPVASGIGGGSVDAAATLLILRRHWNLSPTKKDLLDIAERLGADVPVCLEGHASFIGGIGEKLTPAPPLPYGWLVLANPGMPLPTNEVFMHRTGQFSKPARFRQPPKDFPALAVLLKERTNDLTKPAVKALPVINDTIKALANCEGALLARMSGSGATCFGLFECKENAQAAVKSLNDQQPNWWVRAAPLLTSWQVPPDRL